MDLTGRPLPLSVARKKVDKHVEPKKPEEPKITIRHDSSNQGKVADNEFATYFKGKGTFHR